MPSRRGHFTARSRWLGFRFSASCPPVPPVLLSLLIGKGLAYSANIVPRGASQRQGGWGVFSRVYGELSPNPFLILLIFSLFSSQAFTNGNPAAILYAKTADISLNINRFRVSFFSPLSLLYPM